MQFRRFRHLVFSVPAKEWDRVTMSYSVKGRQNSWFVWTKTWSNRVSCSVSEMFSSPKCNLQLLHLYLRKYNNVSVSISYYYLLLQHEEILLCRPLRGCIHSYGSGVLLWILRPRCYRKCGRVFCEKLEFSPFFLSERKQNRSLLFSSFFKKLFQVEGNGAKGNTLQRWPWPCLLFVPAFNLSAR